MASPAEGLPGLRPLADRDVIGPLRVFASPGHTSGHLSFVDEERGVLLVGDCAGVVAGRLVRAPERFIADLEVAERILRSLLVWRGARMLSRTVPSWPAPGMSWRGYWNAERTGAVTLPERCACSVRFMGDGMTTLALTALVSARESG